MLHEHATAEKKLLNEHLIVPLVSSACEAKNFELYDLSSDVGEKQNVADQNPKIVKRLDALLQKYERENRSRF